MLARPLASWTPEPPYRLDLLLDVLARFAYPSLDHVQDGAYWRVVRGGAGRVLLRVSAAGTPDAPRLDVHQMASEGVVDVDAALAELGRILPLANHTPFYDRARNNPALWNVVNPLVGLPEWRTATIFEALAQAIIEQQISWVSAQRAQQWLVQWAGDSVTFDGRRYYAFPTPERLTQATLADLTPLKITFKRIALLLDLAGQVAAGTLDLEGLRTVPPAEAYTALLAIKGIGPWTAAVTLGRSVGDHRVTPNDVALQAAVNRYFYGGSGRIPQEQVTAAFAAYDGFSGLAAHYTLLRWVTDEYPRV
ncbi:MAG: hypothetical protein K8I60_19260 [Anaerolineae bacterium]|nr:hypothetical protein [Anaerolineae bacterium]